MKAIAMLSVVIYHLGSIDFMRSEVNYRFIGSYIPNLTKFTYSLLSGSVPLFFMVTGALFANKELDWDKCWQKILKLLFVTVVWTVIFKCIINPLFFNSAFPGLYDFYSYYWFLYSLCLIYVFHFLVGKHKTLLHIILLLVIMYPFVTNFIWTIVVAVDKNAIIPQWGHSGFFSLYSIVYFYLGMYISNKTIKPIYSFLIMLLGMVLVNGEVIAFTNYHNQLYDGVNASFPTIGALTIALGSFCLLKQVNIKNNFIVKLITFVGSNTIGIYIFHMFLVKLVKEQIFHSQIQNPVIIVICGFFIVGTTTLIAHLINNSKLAFLLKL